LTDLVQRQLRDALLAPQPLEHDADLLLRREPPARAPVDLSHNLLGARSLAHRILLPLGRECVLAQASMWSTML